MNQNDNQLLDQPLNVLNIGLRQFAEAMEEQEVEVLHIDWMPPAEGDEEIQELLDQLI